ncbi:hypothetical protein Tco_1076393 [Tanacetum coccineum]
MDMETMKDANVRVTGRRSNDTPSFGGVAAVTQPSQDTPIVCSVVIGAKPTFYASATVGAPPAHVVNTTPGATSINPPIKLIKPVVILGVSITSKEKLIGLVNKIESGALDDVIYRLTIDDRQAAHVLVIQLARGFDYVNSDSDTSSEEPYRVTHNQNLLSFVDYNSQYTGCANIFRARITIRPAA